MVRLLTLITAGAAGCIVCIGFAHAQNTAYPTKPIRIITSETGSANDLVARIVANGLTTALGKQVIVDNRGGVGIEIAARSQADGYTLLFYGGAVWTAPFLRDNTPWDPLRDFTAITIAVTAPNVLLVHPAVAVRTCAELIALARAKPGYLNFAAGTIGAAPHLSGELFKAMANINIVRLPYKGTGPALAGLMAGQAHLMIAGTGSVTGHVKSGRVRALAVTSLQPSALMPGLPTLASDLPGFESSSTIAFFAPANLPPPLLTRLHREIVQVLNTRDITERLFTAGVEVIGNTPREATARVRLEMEKWGKLIREAGLRNLT
jgi:tripartite-type tricarboxylate transporter receptor subunit TctC